MEDPQQKAALFSLLDEYFASRPNLFSAMPVSPSAENAPSSSTNPQVSAANSFVSLAAKNPSLVSRAISSHSPNDPYNSQKVDTVNKALGVAAQHPGLVNRAVDAARTLPPSTHSTITPSATPVAPKGRFSPPSGLTSSKAIGSLDTSSGKAAFGSLFKKEKEPPKPYVTSVPLTETTAALPPPPTRKVTVKPPSPPDDGRKIVTAMYDYDSDSPDDLTFKEGEKIVVVEEVTADWWKGECGGRRGLFPTNYVQS